MRDQVTFCIKTIHRPHCCEALVRSIHEYCADDRPRIYVLDDGRPALRFSKVCPDAASMVDQIIETEYDIGLSAGRNRLLEAADTPVVVFTDDDHRVGPQTRLTELVRKLETNRTVVMPTRAAVHEFARNCGAEYIYVFEDLAWQCHKL